MELTGLLLSGGIDSAILLSQLLERSQAVVPFYVRTGCRWEECELRAVRQLLAATKGPLRGELQVLDLPLADLYGDHWSVSGRGVPDESSSDEAVYMPGRNPLLVLKPALWCLSHGVARLAIGTLANNPFDDASPAFFAAFEKMVEMATGRRVDIWRPLEKLSKQQVLESGKHLPLRLTFSCLAPVGGLHCGDCNKCGERQRAFHQIGLADPTQYDSRRAADSKLPPPPAGIATDEIK